MSWPRGLRFLSSLSQRFDFHASLIGLFLKPTHVGSVHVQGLAINIPPKSMRQNGKTPPAPGKIKIHVDEFVCDDSRLVIGTDKPDKDPKVFVLQHIVLKDVGPNEPLHYDATLINAIPKGNIQLSGLLDPGITRLRASPALPASTPFSMLT